MASVSILVVQTQEDILAKLIAEAIERDVELALYRNKVISATEARVLLLTNESKPDAVVLVGDSPANDAFSRALLAEYPATVVVRIAVGTDRVNIDLARFGLSRLIQALRALAKGDSNSAHGHLQYQVIDSPDSSIIADQSVLLPYEENLLGYAVRWIDAALLSYLKKEYRHCSDLAGLSLSQVTVESLITGQRNQIDLESTEVHMAAERAMAEFTAAFANANPSVDSLAAAKKHLGLTFQETQALLLCLAPEIDSKYQRIFGFLHDDLGRRSATLGLICSLLGEPATVRRSLEASNGLSRWRLLAQVSDVWPNADEALRPDASVMAWLLGNVDALWCDPRLRSLVHKNPWIGANWLLDSKDELLGQELVKHLSLDSASAEWILLTGDDVSGWRALLERVLPEINAPIIRIALAGLTESDAGGVEETAIRLARAAALTNAVLILDAEGLKNDGSMAADTLSRLLSAFPAMTRPSVLIAPDVSHLSAVLSRTHCHVLHRNVPGVEALATAFTAAARDFGLDLGPENATRLAAAYPFALDTIDQALTLAVANGAKGKPPKQQISHIAAACRRVACQELPHFAQRLEPCFRLDQVILSEQKRLQLSEIVMHVRQSHVVMDSWGFAAQLPYGRGVTALFFGPSGTGKTMAAQAIAHALDTEIFAVDLSRIISKYIGETEKNLDCIFSEAQRANAVLVFNEADALFGKRSEINDSHDRYANQEVAFLLQRVETFNGVAILTTNFRDALDKSFARRLHHVVEFQKPGSEAREAIWRQCFPHRAPQAGDIDFRFLAKRFELTGANIQQIALRAAFNAANEGQPIAMKHVVEATCTELNKLGMPAAERELKSHAVPGLADRVA